MSHEEKRLKRKVRNSYFISTVSIAMVLFMLGSVTYLISGALRVTDSLRESVTIHVMLDDSLTNEQTANLRKTIETQEVVRQVDYVTKEEAAEQFIAETGDDFSEFIDYNPLPNSFEVGLYAEASEKEMVEAFVAQTEALEGVTEVLYQKSVIERIGANLNKFNLVLTLFGTALLVISLILLNNTIRMTIITKRQIINTMKLVGANRGFIMRQFTGSAALHGLYAGAIATVMFGVLVTGLAEGLPEIELLTDNTLLVSIVCGMIAGGVVISLLFTMLAVDKAVKQTTNKAYL